MPTFTAAIALERLLEPNLKSSASSSPSSSPSLKQNSISNNNDSFITKKKKQKKKNSINKKHPNHIYISSPALYTTPEPAPIPYTSIADSVSPSPYVVNRKRRDLPLPETASRLHGFEIPNNQSQNNNLVAMSRRTNVDEHDDDGSISLMNHHLMFQQQQQQQQGDNDDGNISLHEAQIASFQGIEEDLGLETNNTDQSPHDDFFIPQCAGVGSGGYSMTTTNIVVSNYSSEAGILLNRHDACTPATKSAQVLIAYHPEFFDANEEFFADGSISNASPSRVSNTGELHSARVHLFDEIERRKRAEGALARMHSHWRNIRKQLSGVGISFPATRDAGVDTKVEIDDMVEQLCQEVVVGRFVSEAIGRGLARAETEAAAKSLMESKNLEISRIRDKVEYCEAVNREIFQRNQEAVEIARKQREGRKTKQRWIWSCIGLSITVGASLLAYSYLHESSSSSSSSRDLSADLSDFLPHVGSGSTYEY